jgi:hypothetical protein
MAPVLLRVAAPLDNLVSNELGVTLEVPEVLVYQIPLNHSPPASKALVETVIEDGIDLVVMEEDEADQVPVPKLVTGAT